MSQITNDALMAGLATVLTTAAELDAQAPLPLGPFYMGLSEGGMSWATWEAVIQILQGGKFAVVTSETIRLTPLGLEKAAQIEAMLTKKGI